MTIVTTETVAPQPSSDAPIVDPGDLKVFVETYGCQMNKLDTELVLGALAEDGYQPTTLSREADLILVNTCSIREHAEERVYSRLGMLRFKKHRKPGALLGVIGCMAQRERENIFRRAPHVNLVVGPREVLTIPQLLRTIKNRRASAMRATALELDTEFRYRRDIRVRPDPHQAFVSIMHGCDMRCTFCIVPYTRGNEQSRPVCDIVGEVERLVDDGVREITLLGQTVNSYGKGLDGNPTLADLLEALNQIEDLWRIRYITSHPALFPKDYFARIRDLPRVCRSVHAPAQHGSDRILKRMKRMYTTADYMRFVDRARDAIPDIAIASDFIVGFPGETESEFQATVAMIHQVGFSQSFIFKYSERPGTPSSRLTDDVSEVDKKRRNNLLLVAQNEVSERLLSAKIGQDVEVLINGPSKKDPSRPSGRSGDHRIVILDSGSDVGAGDLVLARVHTASAVTLYARLEQKLDAPLDLGVPPASSDASLTDTRNVPAADHSDIPGRRLPVVGR